MSTDEWVAQSERAAAEVAARYGLALASNDYAEVIAALAYAYREGARDGLIRAQAIYHEPSDA